MSLLVYLYIIFTIRARKMYTETITVRYSFKRSTQVPRLLTRRSWSIYDLNQENNHRSLLNFAKFSKKKPAEMLWFQFIIKIVLNNLSTYLVKTLFSLMYVPIDFYFTHFRKLLSNSCCFDLFFYVVYF